MKSASLLSCLSGAVSLLITLASSRAAESEAWAALKAAGPDLTHVGWLAPRSSQEISASAWSVGCETVDRDYTVFRHYRDYVGELGVKGARLQGGWAKCEQVKGVYDFAWLDECVYGLTEQKVRPWICLCYGNLLPETSKNISSRFACYFEPVGMLAINFYQNRVRGQTISSRLTAEEYGYNGQPPGLETYTFITNLSSTNEITTRGMELEYSQSLSFLPRPFKGLGVYANYARNYASTLLPQLVPHSIKGGLNYKVGRVSVSANARWNDDYFTIADGTAWMRHRIVMDAGLNVHLTNRLGLYLAAQNVLNSRLIGMQQRPNNPPLANTPYARYGTQYTLGLKGSF